MALDAAARGLSVVLLEGEDFAKGTSSRATKLVHGGVRYLAQGDIGLVHEALHERTTLLANAPHVAQRLAFVVPGYRLLDLPFYGTGLKMYDVLAGRAEPGADRDAVGARTQELLPTVRAPGPGRRHQVLGRAVRRRAAGGAAGAHRHRARRGGAEPLSPSLACCARAARCAGCARATPKAASASTLRARCVVNAAGVWVDAVRDMDREADAPPKPADGGAQPGRAPDRRTAPSCPARMR